MLVEPICNGQMTCRFMACSTVYQLYQTDGRGLIKGCVQTLELVFGWWQQRHWQRQAFMEFAGLT